MAAGGVCPVDTGRLAHRPVCGIDAYDPLSKPLRHPQHIIWPPQHLPGAVQPFDQNLAGERFSGADHVSRRREGLPAEGEE